MDQLSNKEIIRREVTIKIIDRLNAILIKIDEDFKDGGIVTDMDQEVETYLDIF